MYMTHALATSVNSSATLASAVHPCPDALAHRQSLIEASLNKYSRFDEGCPTSLREAIRYSLLSPGKRLRPMLVMLAAEACGGTSDGAVAAACAVEMVHTYSLIHDDLPSMDNDDLRRGMPTCHKRYGEATAILAGDALLALAFEVLAKDVKPADVAANCVLTLATACGATALVGGQCDDVLNESTAGSRALLDSIHNRKTGALFLASLRLGGLVAGASETQLRALHDYGSSLGLAFQITDDLRDHDANRSTRNSKPKKGSDANKLTFPNLIGVPESRVEVMRLIDNACKALSPFGSQARSLVALAHFVSDRI